MDREVRLCACHGEPIRTGHRGCRVKAREAKRRYNHSARGQEAKARYAGSPKQKAARKRYEASRIKVQLAGVNTTYRVDPERRGELARALTGFRAGQTAERRSVKW